MDENGVCNIKTSKMEMEIAKFLQHEYGDKVMSVYTTNEVPRVEGTYPDIAVLRDNAPTLLVGYSFIVVINNYSFCSTFVAGARQRYDHFYCDLH